MQKFKTFGIYFYKGEVAQLVRAQDYKPGVGGSIRPSLPIK